MKHFKLTQANIYDIKYKNSFFTNSERVAWKRDIILKKLAEAEFEMKKRAFIDKVMENF